MSIEIPGMNRITDHTLEEQLAPNLIDFFNWILLGRGAFFNVKRPSAKSKMKVVSGAPGTWETSQGNWVWANNIPYSVMPNHIPDVYVNGSLIPNGVGYSVNYRHGQIVFNTPIAATSLVEVEYAHHRYNFYDAGADWFQQVVNDPLSAEVLLATLAKNRVYLPAIIVEALPDATFTPYQLGDYSVIEHPIVLFHIIANHDEDLHKMVRVFKSLFQRTIRLYNLDEVAAANKFPLNQNGSLVASPLMYPEMIAQFPWKRLTFSDIRPQSETKKLPFYRAVVRITFSILMP